MNFGYPNTPYAPMDNINMSNMPTTFDMPYSGYLPTSSGCGCGMNMPMGAQFMQPGCSQVVQKSFIEEMPYYVNYNTHAVSNLHYIKWSKKA